MKEILIIWTLINGEPVDVDAFMDIHTCVQNRSVWEENLKKAAEVDSKYKGVQLVGCTPVQADLPAKPEPRRESM